MENRTDKNVYTIIFAIGMVLVVGSLLAFASSVLKPNIDQNKIIEKQQNILYAMGVNDNEEGAMAFTSKEIVADEFSKYIKKQIVIQDGKVTEDENAYLIDVKKQMTLAKDGAARKLPLFVGEKDGKTFYIVPIRGKGLWDAIWGFVALDKHMVVQGVFFDHKGETAGLGANINKRFFMDDFAGEHVMNSKGSFAGIKVTKGNNDPLNKRKEDNKVDAIAGATITGDGVSAMLKSELKLYQPYFKTLEN